MEDRDLYEIIVYSTLHKLYRMTNYYSWKVKEVYIDNKQFDDIFKPDIKDFKVRCEITKLNNNMYIINGYITHYFRILAEFKLTFERIKLNA